MFFTICEVKWLINLLQRHIMVVSIRTSHRVSMERELTFYKIHLPLFFSINLFNPISSLISPSESHFGIWRHFDITLSNHNDIILLESIKKAFKPSYYCSFVLIFSYKGLIYYNFTFFVSSNGAPQFLSKFLWILS